MDDCPKEIELKNVSYRYEGANHNTLQNINLKINPGEHIAIVGLNGAGKTTLVKLLCGLIDPTEGQIFYDGIDIRKYNRTAFYRLLFCCISTIQYSACNHCGNCFRNYARKY